MFSEIINTICVLVSVSLLFLGATTHKCVKQVEEKVDLVINEINEINELDSDSDSDSDSNIIPKYENETFEFEPFIEKSSSLPDFKDCLNLKKNMSF